MGDSTVSWRIPAEIAAVIDQEAARRGVSSSAIAGEVLCAVVPGWIAASIRDQIAANIKCTASRACS